MKHPDAAHERFIVYSLILITALSFGLNYGIDNQNSYLIHGLSIINPEYLMGDWYTYQTHHYHNSFSHILVWINAIGLPLDTATITIEILLRAIALGTIYGIIKTLPVRNHLTVFALVTYLVILERTISVGGSYVLSPVLQPSSFASTFTLLALLYFLRGNYLLSGFFIAFAGYMHSNFMLLSFVYFGLAHIFLGRNNFVKRTVSQFTLLFILFLFKLPFLLSLASYESSEYANYIFQFIRAPHHYVPETFLDDFFLLCGWLMLGTAGLLSIIKIKSSQSNLKAIFLSLTVCISIATLMTTVIYIPFVSQLFFFRLAPFLVLLSQIVFLSSLIASNELNCKTINNVVTLSLVHCGNILILLWHAGEYGILSLNFILTVYYVLFSYLILFYDKIHLLLTSINLKQNISATISVPMAFIIAIYFFSSYTLPFSTALNNLSSSNEMELYRWVQTTDKSSLFLTPPGMQNFRIHGKRSIVVDWKSTPIVPPEIIEWYTRHQDITGIKDLKSLREARQAYIGLDKERIHYLKNKYQFDYIVAYTHQNALKNYLNVAFKNDTFTVFSLQE